MSIWILLVALGALACVVLVIASVVRARPTPAVLGPISVRLLLAVGVFVVVLGVGAGLVTAAPQLLGLPLVLAPGVGVTAALLLFGAVPWRATRSGTTRTAALAPRAAWSAQTARIYGQPVAAACALVILLVVTGATASPDDAGRSRAFTVVTPDSASTASPYPGWFYAAPLLATTLVMLVAAVVAIRRTALLPALSLDAAAEAAWRQGVAVVLSRVATAGLLLYLAAALVMTGEALSSVAQNAPIGWGAGAIAALLGGAVAAIAAVVSLLAAARRAAAPSAPVVA